MMSFVNWRIVLWAVGGMVSAFVLHVLDDRMSRPFVVAERDQALRAQLAAHPTGAPPPPAADPRRAEGADGEATLREALERVSRQYHDLRCWRDVTTYHPRFEDCLRDECIANRAALAPRGPVLTNRSLHDALEALRASLPIFEGHPLAGSWVRHYVVHDSAFRERIALLLRALANHGETT
jgi:hypothetical protein